MEADANDGLGGAHPTGEPHQHIVEDVIRSVELAFLEESRTTSSGRRMWLAIRLVRLHCYSILSLPPTIGVERLFTQPGRVGPLICLSVLASCGRFYAIPGLPTDR